MCHSISLVTMDAKAKKEPNIDNTQLISKYLLLCLLSMEYGYEIYGFQE
jgi:hypothetical protein